MRFDTIIGKEEQNLMKKVVVMLSTYNGEKYLREQIDSLLQQKMVDVMLLIRDDGSIDQTVSIIQSYNDERITLLKGNNVGVIKSFFSLLMNVPDADYYAFADQDDVWDEMKLCSAISEMEKYDNEPALCVGAFYVVDQNLNKLSGICKQESYTLRKTIVYNAPLGCTEVFNKKLKELIMIGLPQTCRMHDHWVTLVAEIYDAKILYCKDSILYYRQHGNNVVSYNAGRLVRLRRLLKCALTSEKERKMQVLEALKIHGNKINEENQNILHEVVNYDANIYNRLKFAFDKEYWSDLKGKRIHFIFAVLMGVF